MFNKIMNCEEFVQNKKTFCDEKKLYYLDGLGEGVYEYTIEELGSYEDNVFMRLVLYKYEEFDSNNLIDYFDIQYVYNPALKTIEFNTNYVFENIYGDSEKDITYRIIYCENSENNIHEEIFSSEHFKLPYVYSNQSRLLMCLPKVFEQIYFAKLNFTIRKKKVYIY